MRARMEKLGKLGIEDEHTIGFHKLHKLLSPFVHSRSRTAAKANVGPTGAVLPMHTGS